MTESRAVVVELIIAAPIDAVWKALRDPAAIAKWFGWNHPGFDEEVKYIFETHASADGEAYRLRMGLGDEFTLEARGDRTVVRVTRAAPAGGTWDDIYDEITEGWRTFVYQLQFAFDRHPGEERRTVYLSGRTRTEASPRPPDALLGALASANAGDAYAIEAATGDHLSGHVWFRSTWQIGVTVEAFGSGLLIGMRRPPSAKSPFGGGMFVLTLYGFDEAAHRAITERWRTWFEAHFDAVEVMT
jgi:hypothetical protein